MNGPAISFVIKSNLVKDQIVEFFKIWDPYMLIFMLQLLVHGFHKRKRNILGEGRADFITQKTAIK